jgi:hypothetical protein
MGSKSIIAHLLDSFFLGREKKQRTALFEALIDTNASCQTTGRVMASTQNDKL